jgi:serine-type D-Ala-D-Ala carboxypeptidase/endopeptidase
MLPLTTIVFTLIASLTFISSAAAVPPGVIGIWTGTLETFYCPGINCRPINLHFVLHVAANSARKLGVSLDSVDEGAMDLRGDNVVLKGNTFSFDIPAIKADYQATVSADGNSLNGTWSQGMLLPLDFSRITTAAGVAGIWEGDYGSCPLRLVLRVTKDSMGKLGVVLDSVDDRDPMGATGKNVVLNGDLFSFEIPPYGSYRATLSSDGYLKGYDADGTYVIFARTTAAALTPEPVLTRPRVTLDNLKPILDQELKPVLERGLLSNPTGGGLVIGVLDHGQRRIFAYGAARPDSIFEIGSITKTFTGLILAQMIIQKKVSLDEPVRALLPPGFAGKPSAHEITLLDLATQHSGLPRDADDLDAQGGYAAYDVRHLSHFLTKHGLTEPAHAKFQYSNLGFGLLGYALSQRAGVSYAQLVQSEITGPLQMRDTTATLSVEQRKRFIQGYSGSFDRADPMEFNVLQGNGILKSTASDMLTYLDANLHPEKYAAGAAPGSPLATLPGAVALQHAPVTTAPLWVANLAGDGQIALAWVIDPHTHFLGHGGATFGHETVRSLQSGPGLRTNHALQSC